MLFKTPVVCLAAFSLAFTISSCSREAMIEPNGDGVHMNVVERSLPDYRADKQTNILARNIIAVLYDEYGTMCFIGHADADFELLNCLSRQQIRKLNEEHYIRITDTPTCIDIALKIGLELSPGCLAGVVALDLQVNASWSCIKKCSTITDPNLQAQCLKNCEEKDPYQE